MMSRPTLEFIFQLAGHLGKYAADIMREMSSWEFTYWRAYDQIHPLEESSWGAGLIVSEMWKMQNSKNTCGPEAFLPVGATYRARLINEQSEARRQAIQRQAMLAKMQAEIDLAMRGQLKQAALELGKVNGRSSR